SIAGVFDRCHRRGNFAQISQEDLPPFSFLTYAFSPVEIDRKLSADGLKAEPELLHDFRIRRHGFLGFTCEGDPHARHVYHHRNRTNRELPSRLRQTISSPIRGGHGLRSEEHTSELQSRVDLVCRLLL